MGRWGEWGYHHWSKWSFHGKSGCFGFHQPTCRWKYDHIVEIKVSILLVNKNAKDIVESVSSTHSKKNDHPSTCSICYVFQYFYCNDFTHVYRYKQKVWTHVTGRIIWWTMSEISLKLNPCNPNIHKQKLANWPISGRITFNAWVQLLRCRGMTVVRLESKTVNCLCI